MPTLEQICKRLFTGPSWFARCLVGALLLAVPVAHFFAFGYLYDLVARARTDGRLELPEWVEWRRLFTNGVAAFVIFSVLGLAPLALGWALTWPLRLLNYGVFVYLPMVPAAMLAAPLSAAGIYQYQKREEYRDAFRWRVLAAMLRSSKARFFVPGFALVGFVTAVYPLMTLTLFVALAAGWSFFAAFFRSVEEARRPVAGPAARRR
ncbi:MAG: DUF4013 domain-containing protein [Opitutaceae bacterium]|jgi:hypothetical protein|nr:DUF4013 domain-containing protein [Opitutaceae bacterium]